MARWLPARRLLERRPVRLQVRAPGWGPGRQEPGWAQVRPGLGSVRAPGLLVPVPVLVPEPVLLAQRVALGRQAVLVRAQVRGVV